jgi:hypothetical protein
MIFELGNKRLMIDFTVVRPDSATHFAHGLSETLQVAKRAEAEKRKKYELLAEQEGCEFLAFAVETYGGWGPDACEVVKRLLKHTSHAQSVWAPKDLVYNLERTIAVAIQKRNAAMILKGLHAARRLHDS